MDKISWKAPEYIHSEKTTDWYWIVGIITISIAVIAVILNNIIFGILIVTASFTLSLFASRKPSLVDITIDNSGVTSGKIKYPYSNLESFWVETRDAHHRIILKSKKLFMPFIVLLIENADPEQIHSTLSKYLKEEEHTEPLLEKIIIYLGF
ncbi:MAG: hypothetical protein ABL899_01990 [Nitrospira sp.]